MKLDEEKRLNLNELELDEIDDNPQNDDSIVNVESPFQTFLNASLNQSDDNSNNNNEVIIRDPSQFRNWLDEMKKKTFRQKVKHILRSGKFHLALIILVIIESLFVAGEVIIYDLEAYLIKHHSEPHDSKDTIFSTNHTTFYLNNTQDTHLNKIPVNISMINAFSEDVKLVSLNKNQKNKMLFKLLHIAERTCKYGSLAILTVFMIEIIVKILFDPKSFRRVLEILDGLVITISFSVNMFLLLNNIEVHAISGLITLLRLWRIAEIIQAIAVAIEAKYKSKFKRLEKKIKCLEAENEFLRSKLINAKKQ